MEPPVIGAGDLAKLVPSTRVPRLIHRAQVAAVAFAEERYGDARSILRPIITEAPDWMAAQELFGLTMYRLGLFRAASGALERVVAQEHTFEHHAVLADCFRAQRKWERVEVLWAELGEASPDPDIVAEGRIVYAGSLADRGRLSDAIRVMEKGWRAPKRPQPRHLQRAYVLADLYERQGLLPRARELFRWVQSHEPGYFDVAERARS